MGGEPILPRGVFFNLISEYARTPKLKLNMLETDSNMPNSEQREESFLRYRELRKFDDNTPNDSKLHGPSRLDYPSAI